MNLLANEVWRLRTAINEALLPCHLPPKAGREDSDAYVRARQLLFYESLKSSVK